MLKKLINTARIDLEILPVDPLLVKSGQATVSGVDMSFVRTHRFDGKDEPFIPGSSLKGMIRAYSEKICRTLRDDPVPVCLPYLDPRDKPRKGEERQFSCGLRFEKYKKDNNVPTIASTDIYKYSCPICRLFGSHDFIGRFATSDAYLTDAFRAKGRAVFEIRDGVAIDRLTGGTAGGAKYDLEVLTWGEFGTTLEIRNFERWQLGLVGLVLRDMEEGRVRLGFGKSRGFGLFKANILRFEVSYYRNQSSPSLCGLYTICEKERDSYGFAEESEKHRYDLPQVEPDGLRYEFDITECWKQALAPGVEDLKAYIGKVPWPDALEAYLKRRDHGDSSRG